MRIEMLGVESGSLVEPSLLQQVLLAAASTVATELCIPHCHWKNKLMVQLICRTL